MLVTTILSCLKFNNEDIKKRNKQVLYYITLITNLKYLLTQRKGDRAYTINKMR